MGGSAGVVMNKLTAMDKPIEIGVVTGSTVVLETVMNTVEDTML